MNRDRPKKLKRQERAKILTIETDPIPIYRRLLDLGIREKRRKLSPNVRLADPNRVRHRNRCYFEKVSDAEQQLRRRNWKRSKVGRAHKRKQRRPTFQTKSAKQIRTEHWAKKIEQINRRITAARALFAFHGIEWVDLDPAAGLDPGWNLPIISVVDDSRGLPGILKLIIEGEDK